MDYINISEPLFQQPDLVIWSQTAQEAQQVCESIEITKDDLHGLHVLDKASGYGLKSFVLPFDQNKHQGIQVVAI